MIKYHSNNEPVLIQHVGKLFPIPRSSENLEPLTSPAQAIVWISSQSDDLEVSSEVVTTTHLKWYLERPCTGKRLWPKIYNIKCTKMIVAG